MTRLFCLLGFHAPMTGDETNEVRATAGDPLVWCARCGRRLG